MIFQAVAFRVLSGLLLTGAGVTGGIFIAQTPATSPSLHDSRFDHPANNDLREGYEAQLAGLRGRIERAERELLIERTSRRKFEKNFADVQIELGHTRDQLAFFEELFPPGPTGAIRLRAANFDLDDQGLSYRVLLMRSGKSTGRFCGRLQFMATGTQNGLQNVTVKLEPLQIDTTGKVLFVETENRAGQDAVAEEFALDFAQFQRSQGYLALPEGFEPKHVTVRVLNGSIVLVSRRVDL